MATDIDSVDGVDEYDSARFGGFSLLAVDRAGSVDLMFEDNQVKAATDRVKKSEVLEMLAKWHAGDHPDYSQGGRPRIIAAHAVLAGLVVLGQEFSPLFMRGLSIAFQTRLSPAARSMLEFPESGSDRLGARKKCQRWEKNTNNAFHRIVGLMDPYPTERHKALTCTQASEVLSAHDEDHERAMKLGLDEFTNTFMLMIYNEQPRRLRGASKKIDVSIDQSSIAPPNKKNYSKKTLGERGHAAAQYIEGGVYYPATPTPLKDATKDKHRRLIDVKTYLARVKERSAFERHAKERPDASGKQPLRWPELGDSPTITCPLRELSKKASSQERPDVEQNDTPEFLDRICQKHSVLFTTEDTLRQKQAFPFMSPEWDEFHNHARQSIESLHSGFKDDGKEVGASSGRRRVRGFTAGQILVTIMLINFNLRTIAKFLRDEVEAESEPDRVRADPIIRRRDQVWENPYTKTTARDSILDIAARGELESPLRT